jgi:hypothetical protein
MRCLLWSLFTLGSTSTFPSPANGMIDAAQFEGQATWTGAVHLAFPKEVAYPRRGPEV